MSYKEIIDNVSNIEDLDNTTILKVLEKFSKTIKDFAIEQSGLNNLVSVEFIPSDNNTTYTGNSVDYLGTLKLTLSDNIIVNKYCNIKFNIKSSNTIVVDVDEFNNSLELHLDNSVVTTLNFAESERQKSKNLFPNETVSGTIYTKITLPSPLKVGTYTLSLIATSSDTDVDRCVVSFQGDNDKFLGQANLGRNTRTNVTITLSETCYSLNFYAGTSYANSNGDTFTYSDIQLEEGSVATDYQPYNGAIVHEKEIADVEHIETIYDMSSSDSNINWGKTSGIKASEQVDGVLSFTSPIALNVNKKYRIYVNFGGDMNLFDVVKNQYGNQMSGCSAVWAYSLNAGQLQMCEFYYLSDTNEIQLRFRKLSPNGTSIEIQTSEYVYIPKIEEID